MGLSSANQARALTDKVPYLCSYIVQRLRLGFLPYTRHHQRLNIQRSDHTARTTRSGQCECSIAATKLDQITCDTSSIEQGFDNAIGVKEALSIFLFWHVAFTSFHVDPTGVAHTLWPANLTIKETGNKQHMHWTRP